MTPNREGIAEPLVRPVYIPRAIAELIFDHGWSPGLSLPVTSRPYSLDGIRVDIPPRLATWSRILRGIPVPVQVPPPVHPNKRNKIF